MDATLNRLRLTPSRHFLSHESYFLRTRKCANGHQSLFPCSVLVFVPIFCLRFFNTLGVMAPFIYDDYSYLHPTAGAERYSNEGDKTLPIAIVGMSCRFPGDATNVENLWKMCAESRDAWTSIPEDRFKLQGYYHPDSSRPGTVSGIKMRCTAISSDYGCRHMSVEATFLLTILLISTRRSSI